MGKEFATIELSSLLAKGGKVRRCRYCSSSRMAWARGGRRIIVLVGSRCAPAAALASPSTFAMVGDDVPAPPSRPEGGLLSRRPSSPRKICAITVELHIVQIATAHRASTHIRTLAPFAQQSVRCKRRPANTLTTRQSSTFARPVVPDCIGNRF